MQLTRRRISPVLIRRYGTDCIGIPDDGTENIVIKLLSVDPSNYKDAPTEGIRRILEQFTQKTISRDNNLLDTSRVKVIRLGT